jgi:hypothetical protein
MRSEQNEVKLCLAIIAFVVIFSCGVGVIDHFIKSSNKVLNSKTQSGQVFLLTPSGKINLGDFKGNFSANKNQTIWTDKNGSKHMTTAAVEFVESSGYKK